MFNLRYNSCNYKTMGITVDNNIVATNEIGEMYLIPIESTVEIELRDGWERLLRAIGNRKLVFNRERTLLSYVGEGG